MLPGLRSPSGAPRVTLPGDSPRAMLPGKVDAILAGTASAPAPTISQLDVPPFPGFGVVSVDEVSRLLRDTPSKQCTLEPVPTSLDKRMCDVFAPIIAKMVNASVQQGLFLRCTNMQLCVLGLGSLH